ncbi:class I SAM-dependent methyltransferase [Tissierella sp. MSJ-40]|uniref:Class I SAM-dependent methyltransferase n=1 Tax=Tissierella simiarum TaxID=2841534 RepID=A0ABS6E8E2_9FIRM|nr:class I SAM-dependent methyltransferase [Tissierella simiarum]MBU5439198.1 class I SAM-dependent methyltransferase [Tissierella simiarum]
MDYKKLKEYWLAEEKKSFQGWNFSYISNRKSEEPLPWDYDKIIRQYLKADSVLLDMGTGGGEYLLSLEHPYQNTFATEAYPPNVELCKNTLIPLGIDVRQVFNDHDLPYENYMFDIIINRHESFDINEVYRLLKPNGLFITQQVGGLNNKEISKFLIDDFKEITSSDHNLANNIELIQNRGFTILKAEEYFPKLKFFDVGALVYFAKIIEWEFPNFTVDSCYEKLCELHSIIEEQGFIESREHRFIIVAQKLSI